MTTGGLIITFGLVAGFIYSVVKPTEIWNVWNSQKNDDEDNFNITGHLGYSWSMTDQDNKDDD